MTLLPSLSAPRYFMPTLAFLLSLVVSLVLALWLLLRTVINTDPALPANVALALALIFVAAACLATLSSWALIRQLRGEDRKALAMRHGGWAGLFLIALPLLRWAGAFSPLVIAAILLIIVGLEALLLLQGDGPLAEPIPAEADP